MAAEKDPIAAAFKDLFQGLAPIRLHQMETEREGAVACDHTISTLHHGRLGRPIFAQCRRAEAHAGLHEDEFGRRWRPDGVLVDPEP